MATARVESAAGATANVHGSCEPTCDDRATAQDGDQDGSIQKEILQLLVRSSLGAQASELHYRISNLNCSQLATLSFDKPARVHTLP